MIIYKVTFPNNKIYIGQTIKSLSLRKSVHLSHSKKGSKNPFHCALRKYGFDAASWEIIDIASSLDELNKKETYWILNYNSICESEGGNGYNITYGGNNRTHSLSSRLKMSSSKKGKKVHSDNFYKNLGIKQSGINNPFYGKKHTDKTKKYISDLNKNKIYSEERKAKVGKGPIIALNKDTNEIVGEYLSTSQCARILKLPLSTISQKLNGRIKKSTCKGLIFKRVA